MENTIDNKLNSEIKVPVGEDMSQEVEKINWSDLSFDEDTLFSLFGIRFSDLSGKSIPVSLFGKDLRKIYWDLIENNFF